MANNITLDLRGLKKQLKRSELIQSSLYKIAQSAHTADSLYELYSAIHKIINKLMYAKNFYIAIFDENNNILNFPYYVDEKDKDYEKSAKKGTHRIKYDRQSLTGHCLSLGVPLIYNRKEILDLKKLGEINPLGTISEIWLGCPLKIDNKTIGIIVVQSYNKSNKITKEDRDLLNFVSELLAMVIQRKQLEAEQFLYQTNLEKKIRERTKELFFAKERAESAAQAKSEFLAGDNYTIADIATWPWIARHEWHDVGLKNYKNLTRWYLEIAKRSAVIKGYKFMNKELEIPLP